MDSPTIPGERESRPITANNVAKNTIELATNSSRTASHLQLMSGQLQLFVIGSNFLCEKQNIQESLIGISKWCSISKEVSFSRKPKYQLTYNALLFFYDFRCF